MALPQSTSPTVPPATPGERASSRVAIISYASQSDPFCVQQMELVERALTYRSLARGSALEFRRYYGGRDKDKLARQAGAMAAWNPDLVISQMTNSDLAALAATEATQTPIVCWSMDPVDSGLIRSMRRPGGRLTGVAFPPVVALLQVRAIKLLRTNATRIGYLHNPTYPPANGYLAKVSEAARMFGMRVNEAEVTEGREIAPTILDLSKTSDALIVGPHELFNSSGALIGETALRAELLAIGTESVARGGGAVAYVPDFRRIWDVAADIGTQILEGAQPGDLPIARHIMPRMILNSDALRSLRIAPPAILVDEADVVLSAKQQACSGENAP